MTSGHFVIMAGGTGGHVFPALAVADKLREQGHSVSWLGTARGLEAELVPAAGYEIDFIGIAGLRGNGALGWLLAPWRVSRALWQSLAILRRRRPVAVLGMGGFAAGPGGLAAWLRRTPLVIHEQNAVAGLTNRLLSRLAGRVLAAFPQAFGKRAEPVGNPLRTAITELPPPELRLAGREGPLRLLVLGGSLGAAVFNEVLPQALASLPEGARPQVRQQTGKRNIEAARSHYAEAGIAVELLPFIDEMAAAYGWADLVLCRAGALTVSELAAVGVASVLVPYPHAVDDHQRANAAALAEAGAAVLLPQAEMTPKGLAELLSDFCADAQAGRSRLAEMANRARAQARPAAAAEVAAICIAQAGLAQQEEVV